MYIVRLFFMKQLTPKEQKILGFIRNYSERHLRPPTYAEIQIKFNYKSASSIQQFVEQLVNKGHLKAPLGQSKKRALELVDDTTTEIATLRLEGEVAAGRLTEAISQREFVKVPRALLTNESSEYFALKVKGDSMIGDYIMDGDMVIIKRQSIASNGQTIVAMVDNEATIKKFYQKKTGIELHPANPNYDIIRVKRNSDFKILGIMTSLIRKV